MLSGHSGPFVTAAANTIPQVICLMVVGGLAAALLRAAPERESAAERQDAAAERQDAAAEREGGPE